MYDEAESRAQGRQDRKKKEAAAAADPARIQFESRVAEARKKNRTSVVPPDPTMSELEATRRNRVENMSRRAGPGRAAAGQPRLPTLSDVPARFQVVVDGSVVGEYPSRREASAAARRHNQSVSKKKKK